MELQINRNLYTGNQANGYYEDAGYLIEHEAFLIRSLLEQIPNINTANLLDAGCGGGLHLQNLRNLTSGDVYGVDVSDEMLAKAKEALSSNQDQKTVKFAKVDLIEDDICSVIGVPEKYFDAAISTWVLCHAPNVKEAKKMIGNVARTVKSGGKFYVITCNPEVTPQDFDKLISKYSFTLEIADKTKEKLYNEDSYIFTALDPKTKETTFTVTGYYYDRENLENIFSEEGFKVERIVPLSEIKGVPAEFSLEGRVDGAIIEATKI